MEPSPHEGVDLSGLHRELDRLKSQLCRCRHEGTCLACRGFEVLREQSQTVVAAASQPVLMQVAHEAAVRDLMSQIGNVQQHLADDPELQTLMDRVIGRIADDLGGPAEMERFLESLGLRQPDSGSSTPPDDRPPSPCRPPSPPPDEPPA